MRRLFLSFGKEEERKAARKKGRKKVAARKGKKIQLQLRIRMAGRESCVWMWNVASLATSIMAFYSAGKIDSVIEQFSTESLALSYSNTHSTLFRL